MNCKGKELWPVSAELTMMLAIAIAAWVGVIVGYFMGAGQ